MWLNEYETLDDARNAIAPYVERYHHRPHSGLNYKIVDSTPQTMLPTSSRTSGVTAGVGFARDTIATTISADAAGQDCDNGAQTDGETFRHSR